MLSFERNYRQTLEYGFRGLYPIELNSTVVQYQNSQVLKATASFNYDRYVCGKTSTASVGSGSDRNKSAAEKAMMAGGGGEGTSLLNPPAKVGPGNKDLIPPRSQEEIDYASQLGDKLWGNNNQTPSNTGWFDAG